MNNETTQKSWWRRHPGWTALGLIFLIGLVSSATKDAPPASTAAKSEEVKTESVSTTSATKIESPKVESPKSTVPAEYRSALNKAGSYANTMHMSKRGVYNQLVSEYGEKFSAEAAQYAVDNVKANWSANALIKAKDYQDRMSMSPAAIHNQLTSEYGEKFTQAEADYAIQHLND